MKKLAISLAVCGMIFTTSCKQETEREEETVITEDGLRTTMETDTEYEMRLDETEREYQQAERDIEDAVERGDTEAEQAAREASAKAKQAWEDTKSAMKEAGQDTKEAYNRTLEKMKAD